MIAGADLRSRSWTIVRFHFHPVFVCKLPLSRVEFDYNNYKNHISWSAKPEKKISSRILICQNANPNAFPHAVRESHLRHAHPQDVLLPPRRFVLDVTMGLQFNSQRVCQIILLPGLLGKKNHWSWRCTLRIKFSGGSHTLKQPTMIGENVWNASRLLYSEITQRRTWDVKYNGVKQH